jgi:hypothetical protein
LALVARRVRNLAAREPIHAGMKPGSIRPARAARPVAAVLCIGAAVAIASVPSVALAQGASAPAAQPAPSTTPPASVEAPASESAPSEAEAATDERSEAAALPNEGTTTQPDATPTRPRRHVLPARPPASSRNDNHDDDDHDGHATREAKGVAATGFSLQYRLIQPVAGPIASAPAYPSGPPVVTIGYRGNYYAIGFSPHILHAGSDVPNDTFKVTTIGVGANVEADAVKVPKLRSQAYVLLGAALGTRTVSSDLVSSELNGRWSASATAGVGVRHWLVPHVAIGVEWTVSMLSYPIGRGGQSGGFTPSLQPTSGTSSERGFFLQSSAAAALTLVL